MSFLAASDTQKVSHLVKSIVFKYFYFLNFSDIVGKAYFYGVESKKENQNVEAKKKDTEKKAFPTERKPEQPRLTR